MENVYVSSEIAVRIKCLAKNKKIAVGTMLETIDLGRNTMANFKTSMPKADNLAKIADYLGCSVDYLLGRTDNPEFKQWESHRFRGLLSKQSCRNWKSSCRIRAR